MNDKRHDSGSLVGGATLGEVVKGLREHPLYLLMFGFILAALVLCIYAFVAVNDGTLRLLAAGGFILLGVVAFLVLRSIEVGKQRVTHLKRQLKEQTGRAEKLNEDLASADEQEINLSDPHIRKHFLSAISNTRKAITYDNSAFHDEIEDAIASFEKQTGDWANGYLLTNALSYERMIWKFYRQAKRTVFATSNEYWMANWANEERANRIIDAHRRAYDDSKTLVTRVFVFSSIEKLTSDHLKIISRQEKLQYISTRVLILEQNDKLKLPPHLINDFVIIDQGEKNQVIGIESSIDLSSVGAKWIFKTDPDFEQTAQWMEQMSISLGEAEARLGGQD